MLPVRRGKGGNKNKKGGKKGTGEGGDVQVNLIVDPGMFGGRREERDSEEDDGVADGDEYSIPGEFESRRRPRRRRPRRSVFEGLAMEEQWRKARVWLKKITAFDVAGVVVWGAVFLLILKGNRCPSGQFNGWRVLFYYFYDMEINGVSVTLCRCDAYNVASAAACLLCVAFGLSTFFDIQDLHASKASPRTRT